MASSTRLRSTTARSVSRRSKATTTPASSHLLARARRWLAFWLPLARLAPGPAATARFLTTVAELGTRHKLRRPCRVARTVRLVANGAPVAFAVRDIGELHGLREVFVQQDYALKVAAEPGVILDLGGNIGAATVYFATRWPRADIVVLEPDPDTFERLEQNVRPFSHVHPLQLAVAADGGEVSLYRTGSTLTNSLIRHASQPGVRVEAVSLDWLLDGPCGGSADLVKVDIEGSEYDVVRASRRRERIPVLIGELHEDVMGASVREFEGLLPGHEVEIDRLPNGEHAFRAWLKRP